MKEVDAGVVVRMMRAVHTAGMHWGGEVVVAVVEVKEMRAAHTAGTRW